MSFNFLDFNDLKIFNNENNFFLSFLFDLNDVRMPNNTETFDDLVCFSSEVLKNLSEYVSDLVSLKLLKSLTEFRKV